MHQLGGALRHMTLQPRKRIVIYASELAACIGRNPYKNRDDCVKEVYERHFAKPGDEAPMTKRKRAEEALGRLREASPETYELCVKTMAAPAQTSDEVLQLAAVADEALKKNVASDEAREAIAEHVRSAAYTKFGTEQEDGVRVALRERVEKKDDFVKKLVLSRDDVDVFVGGRCDGISADMETGEKTLYEVKNRMRKLLGRVPEYERVQTMAYLHLFDIANGVLVERHKDNVKRHAVPFDAEYWDGVVRDLEDFVEELMQQQDVKKADADADADADGVV